ncbi:MAG: outer membrane beta-barrel protein [Woeseiaceae bacterium]
MTNRADIVIVLITSLIISAQSLADDQRGFVVSAGFGISQIEDDDGDQTFSGDDTGWHADVEYRVGSHFSAGLGFFSLGTVEDTVDGTATTIDADGVTLFARGILPLNETIEGFLRIGSATYSAIVQPGAFDLDSALEIGVGLDIRTSEKLAIRLETRFFNGDDDESARLTTVGLRYQF